MPQNPKLTFVTSAFAEKCPDCGAAISYVQFGGPRVGVDEYTGFQFVQYKCRANFYFDDRKAIMNEDSVRCPARLEDCKVCGAKVGGLVCSDRTGMRLHPFCSDQCAIKWALEHAPKGENV